MHKRMAGTLYDPVGSTNIGKRFCAIELGHDFWVFRRKFRNAKIDSVGRGFDIKMCIGLVFVAAIASGHRRRTPKISPATWAMFGCDDIGGIAIHHNDGFAVGVVACDNAADCFNHCFPP
jgi:hypothetical protein